MTFGNQIVAAVTRGLLGSIEGRGVDRSRLLESAGLSELAIADPDAFVPIERHVSLGREIARALPGQNLGLQTGARIFGDPGGALGYALRRSGTHLRALENFRAYLSVVNRSLETTHTVGPSSSALELRMVPELSAVGHPAEALLAAWVSISRHLTSATWVPLAVAFAHSAIGPENEHAAFFRCAVSFDREPTTLHIPSAVLQVPIPTVPHALEPALVAARDFAFEWLAKTPSSRKYVDLATRQLTDVPLDVRAVDLGNRDGAKARLALALGLIEHSTLFVHEIAFLLGFDAVSTFETEFTAHLQRDARELRRIRPAPTTRRAIE